MRAETWPSDDWLPVHVIPGNGGPDVQWAFFGARRLTEPFFESSVRWALTRPIGRLLSLYTPLNVLIQNPPADLPQPDGFIFHMSRCGSTLVAQMLAAVERNIVVSEAPPLDTGLLLARQAPGDLSLRILRALVGALGRKRRADRRYFVKLDSWHTLALPLMRRAFPAVPWVFLYRDPVEVLVSQARMRGLQTVAGALPAGLYEFEGDAEMDGEEYCARVLGQTCAAAVENVALGGGLLVNYRDLPDAVTAQILPHFGVHPEQAELSRMAEAAKYDAKLPSFEFHGDAKDKQREASAALRALAQEHLAGPYDTLERLRESQ